MVKTIKIATPVALSNLGHTMVGIADTAMVGQLGPVPQAAIGLAMSIFFMFMVFGIGISNGATPLVAAADAKKDSNRISELLRNSSTLNFIIGLGLCGLLYLSNGVIYKLDQPTEVVEVAIPYLNLMGISMIPLSIFFSLKQFTEGLSLTLIAMTVSIIGNVANVLLNYVLIFGHFGFEPMGVMGAAWASLIARILMALLMISYMLFNSKLKNFLKSWTKVKMNIPTAKRLLQIGVSSGLQGVFEVGAFGIAVIMAGWVGYVEQAAHQVALSVAAAAFMIVSGVASAASVRAGNFKGLEDQVSLKRSATSSLVLGMLLMVLTASAFLIFNEGITSLFSNDSKVVSFAAELLIIAAIFQLADGIQVIALGILRGVEDVVIPTIITMSGYWIIALPMAYILGFHFNMGVKGIWYGLTSGLFYVAIFAVIRFYKKSGNIKTTS